MQRIGHRIAVGSLALSHEPRSRGPELVTLRCTRGIGLPAGTCTLEIAVPRAQDAPAIGEPVKVELDSGDGLTTVFTGEVTNVAHTPLGLRIDALDALAKLASLDLTAAYETKSSADIARDLLSRASADPGTVDAGPTFPQYVVLAGRALAHLRELAARVGHHLFTTGDGRVHLAAPKTGAADQTYKLGRDILDHDLTVCAAAFDGVVVWGESKGDDDARAHWLADDLEDVRGEAAIVDGRVEKGSAGKRPRHVRDGAVRTGETAGALAEALCLVAVRPVAGHLDVPGAPAIDVNTLVAIDGLPAPAAGPLLVRRIRHTLDAAHGFITRVEV